MGFETPSRNERPQGVAPESALFEVKSEKRGDAWVQTGFTDPSGKYYSLEEGEELVQLREDGQVDRKSYIRKDGLETPFEVWKEGK
ncbi:MAG: hypothetical protein WBB68_04250 [Candidatus Moraniibacteriota bacterium]